MGMTKHFVFRVAQCYVADDYGACLFSCSALVLVDYLGGNDRHLALYERVLFKADCAFVQQTNAFARR